MTKMFVSERRNAILEYLNKKQRITVKELSKLLNVSEATLRTDLNTLENEGVLHRTHGGAVLMDQETTENTFSKREKRNRQEKIAISKQAVNLIAEGQCIILDASSTALEMARLLRKKQIRLTVVTNGIFSALELKENPEITVVLIGGILGIGSNALEGTLGIDILAKINVDTMFTSASGFTFKNGLTDFNVYEVELKRKMVSYANHLVTLLDHSKFDKNSIASFVSVDQIDTLITDHHAPQKTLDQLKEMGKEVIIA